MTCLTSHQLRALSAAAGVVGRETLRAGLLLTLACAPAPADTTDADTTADPATTSGTTSAAITSSTTTDAQATSGATGDASTGDASTTSDDPTTGGTTLLTEFTTTGETGDLTTSTTSTTDTTDATGTTGGLDDCLDPRTLEVDWVCCEAQNWLPTPQCTPWGPPAPPATSRDLLARARAARLELV